MPYEILLAIGCNALGALAFYLSSPRQVLTRRPLPARLCRYAGVIMMALCLVLLSCKMHLSTALFVTLALAMCALGAIPWLAITRQPPAERR